MPVCLLTDNSATLPTARLEEQERIQVLPLRAGKNGLTAPEEDELIDTFERLRHTFDAILILTASRHLSPVFETANRVALRYGGQTSVLALDSEQIGCGIGLLAHLGARAALEGNSLRQVETLIRANRSRVYTLVAPAQPASNGESAATLIYSIENGQMSAYKKVRTRRHLLECFQEFLEDFDHPRAILLARRAESIFHSRPLRDLTANLYPGAPFGEQHLSDPLAALFGTHTIMLSILDEAR